MRPSLQFLLALAASGMIASPALAQGGDILVRVRGTYDIRSGGDPVSVTTPSATVTVSPASSLGAEASLTYFIDDRLAVEAAFGGSRLALNDANGRTLMSAGVINPGVTVQYYPGNLAGFVRPYIGAGVVYMNYSNLKAGEILTSVVQTPPVTYSFTADNKFAPIIKGGADLAISETTFLNVEGRFFTSNMNAVLSDGGSTRPVRGRVNNISVAVGLGFRF